MPMHVAKNGFFILVAADQDKSRLSLPSAYDLALHRLRNRRWGLNQRTRNRKFIAAGDEVVVYASGKRENGMTFVGRATVARTGVPLSHEDRYNIDSPVQREPSVCVEAILLSNVEVFRQPIPIKSLVRQFQWVRNPGSHGWGTALMAGTMRLSERDFELILDAAAQCARKRRSRP